MSCRFSLAWYRTVTKGSDRGITSLSDVDTLLDVDLLPEVEGTVSSVNSCSKQFGGIILNSYSFQWGG